MSGAFAARRLAVALGVATLAAALLVALLARAVANPVPGGTVPSTLELSLDEPSALKRAGPDLFTATVRAEVTATDTPATLSLGGGGATAPSRRWSEPVAGSPARLQLRVHAAGARSLRNGHELLLVTLMAGGP